MKLPNLPEPNIEFVTGHREAFVSYDKEHMLQFQRDTVDACIALITKEQEHAEQNWQCKDGVHITWKLKELK